MIRVSSPTAVWWIIVVPLVLLWAWKLLNWLWLRPKRLEKLLRSQGLEGNKYRFLVGDSMEMYKMIKEGAKSQQQNSLSNDKDVAPRVFSFIHHTVHKFEIQDGSCVWSKGSSLAHGGNRFHHYTCHSVVVVRQSSSDSNDDDDGYNGNGEAVVVDGGGYDGILKAQYLEHMPRTREDEMSVLLELIACPELEFFLWDGSRVPVNVINPNAVVDSGVVHHRNDHCTPPLLPDQSSRVGYV
ncbi:hypothetical protein PIB30_064917 [Stylosanthes scabra]|uniref:Uncharacterized protein n=1 Tax=Stylosanthes scabra TaxID=79078 RepID=A0ABU6TML3_9FABA|nr:hypothetical protein [Stylosanthes scabra]